MGFHIFHPSSTGFLPVIFAMDAAMPLFAGVADANPLVSREGWDEERLRQFNFGIW